MKVRFVIEVDYSWTGCSDFYCQKMGSDVALFNPPFNVVGKLISADRVVEEVVETEATPS